MLEIKDLTKKYGKFTALNHLNLHIDEGSIFGFVGPNGAGKTTTMKIISGLLNADSGKVIIDGIDVVKNSKQLKMKIGYMPDFFGVYDNLKTIEYMEFYASLYGMVGKSARKQCFNLIELVNLQDYIHSYVDELSRGMKQRLCLARSLVHNPDLLVLDEPASGLDPRARIEMKGIVKELNTRGKTILISSHILPELAQMCSHIGIIENGSMVASGTVEDVLQIRGTLRPLVINFVNDFENGVRVLKKNNLVQNIIIKGNQVLVTFKGDEIEEARLLQSLINEDVMISSYAREASDLETLFMKLTDHE